MSEISSSGGKSRAAQPLERRVAVFASVLAMHVGLILLLVLSKPPAPAQKNKGSLSVFSLAAAAPLAPAVPVAVPVIPAESEAVSPSPEELFAEQQAAFGDPDAEICSPVDVVTAQLVNDPLVPPAIDRVPQSERSISEAIVMWNAEWSATTTDDFAPLADVREQILIALADLPSDCLAMPVIGPRLIAIADQSGRTTFLAFGSGEWTWQQLTEPSDAMPASDSFWNWDALFGAAPRSDI